MDKNLKMIIVIGAAGALVVSGALYYFFVMNKPSYTVNVQVIGNGRVSLGSAGAYTTIIQVTSGDVIELVAVPDQGLKFIQWSGDLSGTDNPKSVVVTKNMNIVAIFTK